MEGCGQIRPALRKKRPTYAIGGGSRGGVRHRRDPAGRLLNPSCELEVLKCIMVREGYLSRVKRLVDDLTRREKRSHGQLQALPPGMVDLLDLLRIATLEIVEAISLWRLSQVTPTPAVFEWNGHNYIMKMLHDCDFLDRVEALRSWLGFQVSGNPFLVPQQTCVGTDPANGLTDRTKSATNFGFDKRGLADVGKQPWLGPLKMDIAEESEDLGAGKDTRSRKRRLRKAGPSSSLAPYAAAVVNDPTLIPAMKASAPATGVTHPDHLELKNTSRLDAPPGKAIVDIKCLVPNLVSKEDEQRICVARQALLEEQTRVQEAEEASQAADEGRDDRRRPRASSIVSNVSCRSARIDSRASASSTCASPTKQRISHFGKRSSRRHGSSVGMHSLDPPALPTLQGPGDMRSIVLTTAGLLRHPPAEAHPGLGPVLLQSDCPGGELHRNPFLHTVSDARSAQTEDLELKIKIRTPQMADTTMDRCSTAPSATSSSLGGTFMARCTQNDPRQPSASHRRAGTAPPKVPRAPSTRSPSFSGQEAPNLHAPGQETPTPRISCFRAADQPKEEEHGHLGCGYSPRGQGLSRKAGAELRALTAAGTAGRRQPPPREARLRRLARDVARHSAELRRLVREEEQLRRALACSGVGEDISGTGGIYRELRECQDGKEAAEDSDTVARMVARRRDDEGAGTASFRDDDAALHGCPAKRMKALLEDKRQEIELKIFDLGIKRDELRCLRMAQKQERERQRALGMERRRAHLDYGQRLPEDEKVAETLEDSSCLKLQKRFRGNVGRAYAAWYKRSILQAATTIQRGVRFIWDRRATRRRLLLHASVRPMQAAIRMFVKRQQYKRLLRQRKELIATCKLQVVSRGMLGRRRAAARRAMIAAATRALEWVSLERLQPGHLKELARAIHGALVDPVRQFPPAGVLGALRAALTILDEASETTATERADATGVGGEGSNGKDMVTFETALGRTVQGAVSAPNLTWEMAARVLERPFRLLRRMRAFASGLGASSDSTPARLLHLSPKAAGLLSAYRDDPSWSPEALSAVTEGGVAAKAFVGWAMELERVYREQPCVEAFLIDAQPAWLRKGRSFRRRRRALELKAEACLQAISVAGNHRRHLETRGLAYGDPVVATEVLRKQLHEAEEAVWQLECRTGAFLAAQAKVEENTGRTLREDVEFAEREASVAAREEEMALRLGQSGPEELEALAGRVRDCGVVLRELQRRQRVWERRCREEKQPLLDEWVPPTEGQTRMSRALGEARAWQEITTVRKARLVEAAGGRRYVKGLSGKNLEAWRNVVETLAACGADIESAEARLAEDVDRFERELSRANAEIAAEKVRSAPWDNATEGTQLLERQEDADAARDERRTAMGATLPPGMLGKPSRQSAEGGQPSRGGPPRRPTLVLLGLDLPASVRDSLRAGLDHEAPGLFGAHVVGADALPSLASAAQSAAGRRGFFGPCTKMAKHTGSPPISSDGKAWWPSTGAMEDTSTPGAEAAPERRKQLSGGSHSSERVAEDVSDQAIGAPRTRADLVQAALSEGKNVSLEVVPGPGLWARGCFLRDLEALLGGLDDGGCGEKHPDTKTRDRANKHSGPTVLLVDGHSRNRSGGGIDLSHGTKFMGKALPQKERDQDTSKPEFARRASPEPERALPAASLAARRVKASMEEAAQCLHDLCTTHGKTPSPFKAIETAEYAALRSQSTREDVGEPETRLNKAEVRGASNVLSVRAIVPERGQPDGSSAAQDSPGLELLLAACHIILHPDRQYDVGEGQVGSTRTTSLAKDASQTELSSDVDVETENAATLAYAFCLAGSCREELTKKPSAKGVAETLREADLDTIPLETAVALRRLVRHPDWPVASPRPDLTMCGASQAFVGWIYAAVAGATELALEAGGGVLEACAGRGCGTRNGEAMEGWTQKQNLCGGGLGARLTTTCGRSDSPLGVFVKHESEARRREKEVLREMEAAMVDENVTVLDDDSPWFSPREAARKSGDGDVQERRQCKTSEVLSALMETVLRPFNVFEEPDCRIPASAPQPDPQLRGGDRFCVTVSRAFGSVYARAVSLGTGVMRRGQAVMARTREEDLIPLLSSNWMEKHDLSALRELRTEPAVWHALVDTLVMRYPNETPPGPTDESHDPHKAGTALAVTSAAAVTHPDDPAEPDASLSQQIARRNRPSDSPRSGVVVLSFRHERRLTLQTSCLLMGRAVSVSVFEEGRSDFWCEAEVPAALTSTGNATCPVGLRVPKECIPLILDDDHPMRMRAILDASDLRHLSGLIADRITLCRIGSPRKGPRFYHYWLDGAIGGNRQPGSSGAAAAGFAGPKQRDEDESGREFKLSLRKRSIGQVVFSRFVSFWVPSLAVPDINESDRRPSCPHVVQRLVIVREFAHRGECGELTGEVHDPDSGGGMGTFVPAPKLTRMLLGDWFAEMKANDRTKNPCARYWRDALTWRLRIIAEPALGDDGIDEGKLDETESFNGMKRTPGVFRLTLDERKPLFTLRRVDVTSLEARSKEEGEGGNWRRLASTMCFDLMLLLRGPASGSSSSPTLKRASGIELVATHRQTMTTFNFSVSATSLVKDLDGIVAACLTVPTALSTELELSALNILRDLAAKWLQYSPGNAPSGRGPTLTLNLPRAKPVVAEPYVSLRRCGGKETVYSARHVEARDAATATGVGPNIPVVPCAPHRRRRGRGARGSLPGSGPRATRKGVATLQVETRNERMVFHGSLAVPRLGHLVESGCKEVGVKGIGPQVLAVSVYEVFTVGSAGKIERHLRFCARDESVRPVVEAATTISWIGTCEGIEGGRLWRVVTQGLSVECTRDETGKCVRMRLKVATEDSSEERVIPRHGVEPGRRNVSPPTSLLSPGGEGKEDECVKVEPKAASGGERRSTHYSSKPEALLVTRTSDEKVKHAPSVAIKREQALPGRAFDEIDDVVRPYHLQHDAKAADAVVVGVQEQQGRLVHPVTDVYRHVPDLQEGRGETGLALGGAGACTDQVTKVYCGWHRVTGVQLHVQCFQASSGSSTTSVTPAGRGGAIGFPRDASLHFLACDSSTGHRTSVNVSLEDVCRNLSVDGGIVEAGLLDAGRRPALAKTIAEKLRLVFEAGGGFRLVLPLPAKWSQACQQAG